MEDMKSELDLCCSQTRLPMVGQGYIRLSCLLRCLIEKIPKQTRLMLRHKVVL